MTIVVAYFYDLRRRGLLLELSRWLWHWRQFCLMKQLLLLETIILFFHWKPLFYVMDSGTVINSMSWTVALETIPSHGQWHWKQFYINCFIFNHSKYPKKCIALYICSRFLFQNAQISNLFLHKIILNMYRVPQSSNAHALHSKLNLDCTIFRLI